MYSPPPQHFGAPPHPPYNMGGYQPAMHHGPRYYPNEQPYPPPLMLMQPSYQPPLLPHPPIMHHNQQFTVMNQQIRGPPTPRPMTPPSPRVVRSPASRPMTPPSPRAVRPVPRPPLPLPRRQPELVNNATHTCSFCRSLIPKLYKPRLGQSLLSQNPLDLRV